MNALHQAVQFIGQQESRQSIDAGAHQLNALASAGCDPNILEDGQSALCLLMQDHAQGKNRNYPKTSDEVRHAKMTLSLSIFKLVEMGADPWAGDPNVWETPSVTHDNFGLSLGRARIRIHPEGTLWRLTARCVQNKKSFAIHRRPAS